MRSRPRPGGAGVGGEPHGTQGLKNTGCLIVLFFQLLDDSPCPSHAQSGSSCRLSAWGRSPRVALLLAESAGAIDSFVSSVVVIGVGTPEGLSSGSQLPRKSICRFL